MEELAITDFRLAGFLLARDVRFLRTEQGDRGDVLFVFCDKDKKATDTLNMYPNSPEQKYDSACKTMHDFVKAIKRTRK